MCAPSMKTSLRVFVLVLLCMVLHGFKFASKSRIVNSRIRSSVEISSSKTILYNMNNEIDDFDFMKNATYYKNLFGSFVKEKASQKDQALESKLTPTASTGESRTISNEGNRDPSPS